MFSRIASRFGPFLISFAVTCTFFINFCAFAFHCGCRSLWAGADAMCNIHAAHGRHCPWCSHGTAGYALVMALICAPQLAASILPRWSFAIRTAVCVALFPASGGVVALIYGVMEKYWSA